MVRRLIWLRNAKGFQVNVRVRIPPSPGSIVVISNCQTDGDIVCVGLDTSSRNFFFVNEKPIGESYCEGTGTPQDRD
jgi:1-acyl-sn-glycerol-3-phosphate acyltransferase